mmetsp:Transcript_22140/g.48417  ORF Transcript_22140/g.48417 Transcript_22140/m.48417 type:complete len:528 (-) Transcript_22140:429-2012(-)|eukprot:CAMPEP_0206426144 /NCGR_PEP_ID=MMETSP0324_2-20121206/4202_1 /ASSEMBLY_ACC=CAM_ASM_000836 /TAXON_ID=2866 /ORGANISM="Crypthecodinium cohnii, Strain Seligo" /LENGTH=527 /DNA_ID=CAMNT_0053891041 /DNA_START=407 /DNA_END=1990 /DNA_ORIENTATION=-
MAAAIAAAAAELPVPDSMASTSSASDNESSPSVPPQAPGRKPAWGLLAFTLFQSYCTTGTVFGWPPLLMVLKEEGVYGYKCPADNLDCSARDVSLNLVFTVGAMANIMGGVVGGPIPSPKVGLAVGLSLMIAGTLSFALASPDSDFAWPLGYVCQGLGGGIIHFATMSLGNAFGKQKGWIMASFAGVLAQSSLLFQLFYALYNAGVSRQALFLMYTALLVFDFAMSMWLWPTRFIQMGDTLSFTNGRMVLHSANSLKPGSPSPPPSRVSCRGVLKAASSISFICFATFLAAQIWFSRCLMGFFSTELQWKNHVLEDLGKPPLDVAWHMTLFNMSQALIGSSVIPVFGILAGKLGHRAPLAVITGLLSISWLVCLLIPAEWPLYIMYLLAGWHRQFFFSGFLNFMTCEYTPQVYGRLVPITSLINGLICGLQNPILDVTLNTFSGDFTPILGIMLGLAVFLTCCATVVLLVERRQEKKDQAKKGLENTESEDSCNSSCEENNDFAEDTLPSEQQQQKQQQKQAKSGRI